MSSINIERVLNGFIITEKSNNGISIRLHEILEKDNYEERDKKIALDLTQAVIDFFCLSPEYYSFEIQIKAAKKKKG